MLMDCLTGVEEEQQLWIATIWNFDLDLLYKILLRPSLGQYWRAKMDVIEAYVKTMLHEMSHCTQFEHCCMF